jgi:hypothetical protein
MVHAGIIIYGAENIPAVARFYRDYIASAPEEFGAFLGFHQGPPVPFLPEEWHGKSVCVVVGMWTGNPTEGEARWQPFLEAAPVAGSMVGPMPYPALNVAFDGLNQKGMQGYWKANFLRDLNDGAIEAHARFGATVTSVNTAVHVYPIDGAVSRVGAQDTAFVHRDMKFAPVIATQWADPADNEANIAWARAYADALAPYSEAGGYINFMDSEDQSRVRSNYGPNWDRLVAIKSKYDPGNLFRVNQNIAPA